MSGNNGEHGVLSSLFIVGIPVIICDFLGASVLRVLYFGRRVALQFCKLLMFSGVGSPFYFLIPSNFQNVLQVPFIVEARIYINH